LTALIGSEDGTDLEEIFAWQGKPILQNDIWIAAGALQTIYLWQLAIITFPSSPG